MDTLTSLVLAWRYWIEILVIVIAVLTAVSSIDDIFVDSYYWLLKLLRHKDRRDNALANAVSATLTVAERPIAIMVPAWKEHEVIFSMLAANSRLLAYGNYAFFVGVYQNDAPSIAEVERAQRVYANVHMVVVPRDGPTSKADCLNEIILEIFRHEAEHDIRFAGIALHDAEDFIHPHELKVFNSLIGKFDFIQLPVFSFSQPIGETVGGIYMDEFAEVHSKDLVVREHISGIIPCAGVAACFSRATIVALHENNRGETFRTSSFTEDYDIALQMHALGLTTTFVWCPVQYTIDLNKETREPVYVQKRLPIATREFFPSELRAAYRQRARWMVGIVFQGLEAHGWRGRPGTKYFLARDRKGIVTGPTVMLGYFALANLVLTGLYLAYSTPQGFFDYVLLSKPVVVDLLLLNLVFLVWRLVHRTIFCYQIYGWRHGLMAAPRLVVANFVNFFASMRAIRIYCEHRITGKPLVWDKTTHHYPVNLQAATASPAGRWRMPSARWRSDEAGGDIAGDRCLLRLSRAPAGRPAGLRPGAVVGREGARGGHSARAIGGRRTCGGAEDRGR
jgi:bacteriophage N4 adsorption protein B